MEGGPFLSDEFKQFSTTVVPLLHVTTRIEGRAGDDLLSDKADRVAFPTVVIMDAAGEPLSVQAGGRSVEVYTQLVADASAFVDLQRKIDAGDATAKVSWALAGARLGKLDMADVDEALEGATLTEAQKTEVAQFKANQAIDDAIAVFQSRRRSGDATAIDSLTGTCVEIWGGGVHPDNNNARSYWSLLREHAKKEANVAMMEGVTEFFLAQLEEQKATFQRELEEVRAAAAKDG